jgi:hypothetical protein
MNECMSPDAPYIPLLVSAQLPIAERIYKYTSQVAHNHTTAHCKLGQIVYHVITLFSSRCTACLVDPYLYLCSENASSSLAGCHCKELTVALLHVRGIQAVLLGSRRQASAARLLPGALPALKVQ